MSQLSKALTGTDYASGPHHYKPKAKKQTTKRTSTLDPHPKPAKKTSDVREKSEAETTPKSPAVQEDTLSSSSSSEELPMGLLCLTSGRELPKIPANQAKFAQFAHIPRELRELRAFHTKSIHI